MTTQPDPTKRSRGTARKRPAAQTRQHAQARNGFFRSK